MTRTAFKNGLIENGEAWMKMIEDRNRTSHTYDEAVAQSVAENILNLYFPAFDALARKFTALNDTET